MFLDGAGVHRENTYRAVLKEKLRFRARHNIYIFLGQRQAD